ncbi:MAG: hypothetical protein WD826_08235 [Actinomycetota bacterium]
MSAAASPPPGVHWRYKLFGIRVPEEYREWVYHDIMSPTWPREEAIRRSWFVSVPYLVIAALNAPGWYALAFGFAIFIPPFFQLWSLSASSDRARKDALDRQSGKTPPQITRQTFYWMFGGLVLAGVIYALVEVF